MTVLVGSFMKDIGDSDYGSEGRQVGWFCSYTPIGLILASYK